MKKLDRSSEEADTQARMRPWLRLASDERLVTLVRRGDREAFVTIYDRHAGELLTFCRNMLRSGHDAEDAVQSTFISAYGWLQDDGRPVTLRPWLFAVARNACLSILRQRRPTADLDDLRSRRADPALQAERQEDVRELLDGLQRLPERQRAALLLAEVHGFSHGEISSVLGIEQTQVKSHVFQARAHLISDREARGADCSSIREELASARGPALLKGHLRRHLRTCAGCRDYAAALSRRRAGLGALLPLGSIVSLRRRVLGTLFETSPGAAADYAGVSSAAGLSVAAGVDLGGTGLKALVAKLATGAALAGAGAGSAVLGIPALQQGHTGPRVASMRLAADHTSSPNVLALVPGSSQAPASARRADAPGSGVAGSVPSQRQPVSEFRDTPTVRDAGAGSSGAGKSPDGTTGAGADGNEHGSAGKSGEAPGQEKKAAGAGEATGRAGSGAPAPEGSAPVVHENNGKSGEPPGRQPPEIESEPPGAAGNSGKVPPGQELEKTNGSAAASSAGSAPASETPPPHGKSEVGHGH